METTPQSNQNHFKALKQMVQLHPANSIIITFSMLIIFWLGINTQNFFANQRAYTDAGVFQSVAQHMAEGKTLYAEVWDHKPPMIYFLNLIPIYLGDSSLQSVRRMEQVFILCGLFSFYFIALLISKIPPLALLSTFVFHYFFFIPEMYQGGNLTEIYASFFVLFGILLLISKQYFQSSCLKYACIASGLFFTLAVFTKEPFAVSTLPWLFYLAFEPKQSWKQRGMQLLYFAIGCLSVSLIIILYCWLHENLDDWLQIIAYNRAYVADSYSLQSSVQKHIIIEAYHQFMKYYTQQSWVCVGIFLVGCVSIFYLPFIKKMNILPLIFFQQFILEQFASNLSNYDIGHYYLQYTASFCLLGLCGLCFITHLFSTFRFAGYAITAVFVTAFVYVDQQPLSLYRLRMNTPYRPAENGILSQTLNEIKNEGDTLWTNMGEYSRYYAETNMQSPCPYIYAYEHLFIDSGGTTGQQKRDALTACLQENPPTYMILSDQAFEELQKVKLIALSEWIKQNYTPNYDVTENGIIIYTYTQPTN